MFVTNQNPSVLPKDLSFSSIYSAGMTAQDDRRLNLINRLTGHVPNASCTFLNDPNRTDDDPTVETVRKKIEH